VAVGCLVVLAPRRRGIFAPVADQRRPNQASLTRHARAERQRHPLGFDGVGRDVWARLLYGARTSLVGS
jgi:peptide/nickel transport system permease protein